MKNVVTLLVCLGATMVLADSENLDSNAPPVISAKAWCVADGADGRVLASAGLKDKLKAASTTKMMCLRVVLGQVDANPELLNEWITISKSAAATPGSRAELAAGESIQLRDAIYATTDFQGVTGVLSCSESGDCGAPLIAVYQIGDAEIGGSHTRMISK